MSYDWLFSSPLLQLVSASFTDFDMNTEVGHISDFDNNEKRLIKWIRHKLKDPIYTTIISYNGPGKNSDFEVLHKRCLANRIESVVSFRRGKNNQEFPYIDDKIHIDMYMIYDNPTVKGLIHEGKYRTMNLGVVSVGVLGPEWGKYNNWDGITAQKQSIEEQKNYVKRDSEICMMLAKDMNCAILESLYFISERHKIAFGIICRIRNRTFWTIVYQRMLDAGLCGKPTREWTKEERAEFIKMRDNKEDIIKGAEVIEPITGLYDNVICMDVASLYPSVAIKNNLAFDTINCQCCKYNPSAKITDPNILKDCRYAEPENGYWICQNRTGVYPIVLKSEREVRENEKRKPKEEQNKSIIDGTKIVMNSGYGVYVDPDFQFFDSRVGELITAFGRKTLMSMIEHSQKMGLQVIYGDTDSLFLKIKDSTNIISDTMIISELQKYCKENLNVIAEHKYTAERFFCSDKKHYISKLKNGGNEKKIVLKGMEGKKNDRAKWVNQTFARVVDDIMIDRVNPEDKLRESIINLESGNLLPELLKVSQKLGQNPEKYPRKKDRMRILGLQDNKKTGDLVEWYYTKRTVINLNDKERMLTTYDNFRNYDPRNIDTDRYKEMLWHTIDKILYYCIGSKNTISIHDSLFPNATYSEDIKDKIIPKIGNVYHT